MEGEPKTVSLPFLIVANIEITILMNALPESHYPIHDTDILLDNIDAQILRYVYTNHTTSTSSRCFSYILLSSDIQWCGMDFFEEINYDSADNL